MSQAEVQQRPGYLVKHVQQLFNRAAQERLRPLNLSISQYAVLRVLADVPGAPAAELARRTFVTRQSLRDVLGGLQKAGLVTVATTPTNRRALPVTLTGEGQKALRRAERVVTGVEKRMLEGFEPAEVAQLAKLLGRCAQQLA